MTSETLNLRSAPLPRWLSGQPLALRVAVVLAGSVAMAAGSWASIPMVPVPMTLQTLALFAIAGLAGPRLTFEIVLVWLLEAAMGLPVLSGGGSGLQSFVGPSGGFLLGMLAAGPWAAWLVQRFPGLLRMAAILALGHAVVLLCGWAWLAAGSDPMAAFTGGVLPYIPGAVIKSIAAALIVTLARARLKAI
jgi:biotin transport system substrate-specific component